MTVGVVTNGREVGVPFATPQKGNLKVVLAQTSGKWSLVKDKAELVMNWDFIGRQGRVKSH